MKKSQMIWCSLLLEIFQGMVAIDYTQIAAAHPNNVNHASRAWR